jgi:hypothetical protein
MASVEHRYMVAYQHCVLDTVLDVGDYSGQVDDRTVVAAAAGVMAVVIVAMHLKDYRFGRCFFSEKPTDYVTDHL